MRTLASARRDFSTIRLYWVRPKEASIPTMITTIISSTKVKPFFLGLARELFFPERERERERERI
jgi:hypothetical protein